MTSTTTPPPPPTAAASPPSSPSSSSLFSSVGSPTTIISDTDLRRRVEDFLHSRGERRDVLIIPPDYTRYHSCAGTITRFVFEYYRDDRGRHTSSSLSSSSSFPEMKILPALGTHHPMTTDQIRKMFGNDLADADPSPFVVHDWRKDVVTIGHAPAEMVSDATYGMVNEPWPAQLNKLVWEKRIRNRRDDEEDGNENENYRDQHTPPPLVISVGQVVPHEVLGMANFNKNLFVGVGGVEAINLSHFIGAVHGMEKLMGRGRNPLRSILNYASESYLQDEFDLWYILTVMDTDDETGEIVMRGLYIGNDVECYDLACDLSLRVNFNLLDRAPRRVVVYLNEEYRSTWLGNKSIYRTRMAIDDGGELIVLAPFVETFGEDDRIDGLIRKVGYVGTPAIMEAMMEDGELKSNLSAVAHMIHGSSEGRFSVRYCPGKLTRTEIESVGFEYADLGEMTRRYNVTSLRDGWNTEADEDGVESEFYYISNPALGLWAVSSRFEEGPDDASPPETQGDERTNISGNQRAIDMSGGVGGWKQPPPALHA